MSNDEMGQILAEAVRATGGEVAHAALVEALRAAKHDQVLARLPALVKAGYVKRRLIPQEQGPATLVYSLPQG
jgi:hypothetical protein